MITVTIQCFLSKKGLRTTSTSSTSELKTAKKGICSGKNKKKINNKYTKQDVLKVWEKGFEGRDFRDKCRSYFTRLIKTFVQLFI